MRWPGPTFQGGGTGSNPVGGANVYSHVLQSADKDAADALGRIFDKAIAPADEEAET
jgi:hypothetical protein